ncbi:mitochondrial antiviral-signaling protein isoform X2 [Bufo bufo]|uniref:mitochondrial antiviral-signaling protein isoform X2 n=1 Tax=Bufo bufo TaxID=8384 RepID=UPI001ABDBE0C|nr:mitochondrial antiviral-signaling protein isoform X2 [Bufo bufo]
MSFADDKFEKYLQNNLRRLENIALDELLPHLTPCLSLATVEKLKACFRNEGIRKSVMTFYLDLIRGDDWPKHFINALKACKHEKLAKEFEEVYASYQLPTNQSGPLSLPASLSQHNHQPTQESPQRSSSLPGQMPSTSLDAQPGPLPEPSQRFNPIQPEQQMTQRSPSQHNHEFRSLPPFPQDPPVPPRNPLSHKVSEPVHSDGRTVDDTSGNPVPETTPYQATLPVGEFEALQKDESSISENPHIGPDLLPSHKLSPNLKEPLPGVSIKPSSQDVSPIKISEAQTNLSYSPSSSSDGGGDIGRGPPVHNETQKLPEQFPAYITVKSIQEEHGESENKEQSDTHEASNLQEHPASSSSRVHSVREKVVQGNGRPALQAASSGSSCRPLDSNNEEEYLSKPGALVSTDDLPPTTAISANPSVMSYHDLQISNDTEMNESSNATGRSSSPSITQKIVPLASTPNNMSLKHSAEENDFMFDSRSSPGRNRSDHFSSKQPEENSFGSSDVRRYSLHFNERPEENLMGSNDDVLRNRPRKSPNTSEPNDQNTQKKTSKTSEGRDRERTVLVTITAASICLSLYLLWKIQQK